MTDNTTLVSVVISFLNPGLWLADAIESVLNQTYTNWQLILVDDGSVYEDSALAIGYLKKYPGKIIYAEHENHINKGLTISRNTGIALATGNYVAFLDADDCWLPEKLERQLEIFKQHPHIEMLCEASLFWYTWANPDNKNYLQLVGGGAGDLLPAAINESPLSFG